MRARRVIVAGALFLLATLLFVWRKRFANYSVEEVMAMKAAVLCGLASILLLVWGRALRRKGSP